MAKVSTETKLVVKLFKERMESLHLKIQHEVGVAPNQYFQGKTGGLKAAEVILDAIIAELEEGR